MTPFRLILLTLLFCSAMFAVAQRDVDSYIHRYDSLAVSIMLKHQFPASLLLGLAIHESGAGTSRLSREQCNHFGMKGKAPSSKTKSGYAFKHLEFETDEASFFHFAALITNKKFYKDLKGNPDPLIWLKALKRSGYAASAKWVARVNNIIKKYNLTNLDKPLADSLQLRDHLKIDTLKIAQ
ncbi:MAG: hypothetical protein A2X11_14745 [Bacteroidetes bacterium GWE2_42_24]|nr:MAG: hypothetical protein A2X11_14745 [Bacteroidetes bacterium GWE2_42_24]